MKSSIHVAIQYVADKNILLTELLSSQILRCIFSQVQYMLQGLLNCSSISFLVVLDHLFHRNVLLCLPWETFVWHPYQMSFSFFFCYSLISSRIFSLSRRLRATSLVLALIRRPSPISGTSWQVFLAASCFGVSASVFPPHRSRTRTQFIMHFGLYSRSHVFLNVYLNSSF